jgi:raffinose/stachyose/melibiose transport system substrate-binding protein
VTRTQFANGFGLIILAAAFFAAGVRIFHRERTEAEGGVTLRLAHWQLESGMREAYELIARDYEALHPGVRIRQIPIPERIYSNWSTTQLIGGTAPDLMQLGFGSTSESANITRYFHTLTAAVEEPNPYNVGTSLERVPWRNTFLDGLESAYDSRLFEVFGVSPVGASLRLYYNRSLLRRITGSAHPPRDYAEFERLAELTADYSRRIGRPIVPLAGSRYNAPFLMNQLLSHQSQRLGTELNPTVRFPASPEYLYLAMLDGRVSLRHPALEAGFGLMREIALQCPPGFMQLSRDDAMLLFAQQHALMVMSGSWDATGLRQQAPFELGVAATPFPSSDHPRFGQNPIGPVADSGMVGGVGLIGVTRASRHPEQALDFLRFLTSRAANERFSHASGWLPVIDGVPPPEFMRAFMPRTSGFPNGPSLRWGNDTVRWLDTHLHHLFAISGSVDRFVGVAEGSLAAALRSDLERDVRNRQASVRRNESSVEAARQLLALNPTDAALLRKREEMVETQNETEANAAYLQLRLSGAPLR